MRLRPLLRSSAFRLTLVYAAVFELSVAVLFAVIYFGTAQYVRGELEDEIERELAALQHEYQAFGTARLVVVIAERAIAPENRDTLYLLQDERGKSILKTSVFFDVGNVWQKVGDFGDSFEAGAGIGFRVNTPIGPLRLDLGFPVTQLREEDREPQVHFNISRSF